MEHIALRGMSANGRLRSVRFPRALFRLMQAGDALRGWLADRLVLAFDEAIAEAPCVARRISPNEIRDHHC
jgi:hypothetical protein